MKVELQANTAYVVIASPGVVAAEFDDLISHLGAAVSSDEVADSR